MPLKTYRSSGGSHFNLPKRRSALRLIERPFHCCSSSSSAHHGWRLGEQHIQRLSTAERQDRLLPPSVVQTFSPSQKDDHSGEVAFGQNSSRYPRAKASMVGDFLTVLGLEALRTPICSCRRRSLAPAPCLSDGRSHGRLRKRHGLPQTVAPQYPLLKCRRMRSVPGGGACRGTRLLCRDLCAI